MKREIALCDLCECPLDGRVKFGVMIEIARSIGGWGNRQHQVTWSGEVCETCYAEHQKFVEATNLWLKKRQGVRTPTITITERDVSFVRTDDPPSKGREGKVLPKLSHLLGE